MKSEPPWDHICRGELFGTTCISCLNFAQASLGDDLRTESWLSDGNGASCVAGLVRRYEVSESA
jgi:hypothetical protein